MALNLASQLNRGQSRGLSFDGGLTRPGALGLCRGGLGVSLPAESDISGEARRNTSGNLYTGKTTREGLR